jgi:hypothetical protein
MAVADSSPVEEVEEVETVDILEELREGMEGKGDTLEGEDDSMEGKQEGHLGVEKEHTLEDISEEVEVVTNLRAQEIRPWVQFSTIWPRKEDLTKEGGANLSKALGDTKGGSNLSKARGDTKGGVNLSKAPAGTKGVVALKVLVFKLLKVAEGPISEAHQTLAPVALGTLVGEVVMALLLVINTQPLRPLLLSRHRHHRRLSMASNE